MTTQQSSIGATPQRASLIAADLTKAQRLAMARLDPDVWYGPGTPSNVQPSVKGRLTTLGLLERHWIHKVGGSASHGLTDLGVAVRNHLLKEQSSC